MKAQLLRFARRSLRQGSWPLLQRYVVARKILSLPPIKISQSSDFAIHALVCEGNALMLHWAVRSFAKHVSEPFHLVIHDDGSCSPHTLTQFLEAFPGAQIILRREALIQLASHLQGFPNLLHENRASYISVKWIDYYLLGNSKCIIFLDPDVLFFDTPVALFDGLDSARWMRDCFYALHITPEESIENFGGVSLPQLNSGLGRMPRSWFDPVLASRVMDFMQQPHVQERAARLGLPIPDDQSYNAVFTAVHGSYSFLPESYQVSTEPGLQGVIAKHYTTPNRFLFFEEGIPRVARQLGLSLPRWLRERG